MDYIIDNEALYALIDEEVSRAADEAYADGGVPLYDSVVLTEKDRATADRFMADAVNAFASRCADICTYGNVAIPDAVTDESELGQLKLIFYVPDMPSAIENAAKEEITRYIALFASNGFFQTRRAGLVPQYAERVQQAMDKAVTLLRTRTAPTRS